MRRALAAAQRAGPSAMNGLSAGAANTSSRSVAARSMTLSATRTPALGAAPPTANIPYGRLSRPNSDPSGISIALITPPLLIENVRNIPRAAGSVEHPAPAPTRRRRLSLCPCGSAAALAAQYPVAHDPYRWDTD